MIARVSTEIGEEGSRVAVDVQSRELACHQSFLEVMPDFGDTSRIGPTMSVEKRFQQKLQAPVQILEDVFVAIKMFVPD